MSLILIHTVALELLDGGSLKLLGLGGSFALGRFFALGLGLDRFFALELDRFFVGLDGFLRSSVLQCALRSSVLQCTSNYLEIFQNVNDGYYRNSNDGYYQNSLVFYPSFSLEKWTFSTIFCKLSYFENFLNNWAHSRSRIR